MSTKDSWNKRKAGINTRPLLHVLNQSFFYPKNDILPFNQKRKTMTTRIFIGSSSEGLKVAQYIKEKLNNDPLNADADNKVFECIMWNDGNVFEKNTSYLHSLLKAASMFDFGILVATKDDSATIREMTFDTPRDNVIFEFGLFIGRIGTNRAFVVQEQEAKLPSDLAGISVAQFIATDDLTNCESLNSLIKDLRDNILEKIKLQELGLLPSTGLAIGFVDAFVCPVCDHLFDVKQVVVNGTSYKNFEIQIYIPRDLKEKMRMEAEMYYDENGFQEITLEAANGRAIKTVYKVDQNDPTKLIFADMPTTLTALYKSIVLYLKVGHVGKANDQQFLEARELNNFKLTLQTKLAENNYYKKLVKIVEG